MKPLISIITPSFNVASFIETTILAVQSQTYTHWEWFIVDDGSTDNTVGLIKKLAVNDHRIKLIELKENKGAAIARNKGIELATGCYMTFIDADDSWLPNFLDVNRSRIEQSEGFLCSSYFLYDEFMINKIGVLKVPNKANYADILKTNTIGSMTAFIDINRLGKELMPDIQYRQDMGLWLKYLKKISFVEGIQECLAIYRIRENSHSRSKKNLLKHQWHFYRKVAQLNMIKSVYFFTIWVFYGLKKYYI